MQKRPNAWFRYRANLHSPRDVWPILSPVLTAASTAGFGAILIVCGFVWSGLAFLALSSLWAGLSLVAYRASLRRRQQNDQREIDALINASTHEETPDWL